MEATELYKDGYLISTDKEKLDVLMIHDFLSNESGWSKGIPLDLVKKSIANSLNFGLYLGEHQIGYARVISDCSTIAYLGDIFILEEYRKLGLSKWLMEVIMNHKELQNLRRWILLTSTAGWLYKKYGFTKLSNADVYMEKYNPAVYK